MKFNPFRPNSIVGPGMFIGRAEELQLIEKCLFQAKNANPQHFLIEGERGIGKSSLLLYVDALASGAIQIDSLPRLRFIVVSTELKPTDSYSDIVAKIAIQLKQEIEKKETIKALATKTWDFLTNWEVLGVKYQKQRNEIEPYQLLDQLVNLVDDFIRTTESEIDGILILLDEADKPEVSANLGEFVKLFTERLTKKQTEKICLGLAGLPTLTTRLRESHESAPRVFIPRVLKPLTTDERKQVVRRGLEEAKEKNGFEITVTPQALELISALSEGYPHFIQQFAYSAFEQDTDNNIDENDVSMSAFKQNGALQQLGHRYFYELYFDQISSDQYREVLNVMASHLDNWVTREKIIESGIVPHTVDNALKSLKGKGIILANERQKGQYRLPMKSFAVWIKALSSLVEKNIVISPTGEVQE